jgi:hypothetical protein
MGALGLVTRIDAAAAWLASEIWALGRGQPNASRVANTGPGPFTVERVLDHVPGGGADGLEAPQSRESQCFTSGPSAP